MKISKLASPVTLPLITTFRGLSVAGWADSSDAGWIWRETTFPSGIVSNTSKLTGMVNLLLAGSPFFPIGMICAAPSEVKPNRNALFSTPTK